MPLIDYLLLTPLDEEWRSVRAVLRPDPSMLEAVPRDSITYYLWREPVDCPPDAVGEYLIAAASMGRRTTGQVNAGVFSTLAVNEWKPNRVVLVGIAGSLEPLRLHLGDVVVSDEIFGYVVGDATGKDLTPRPRFNQIGALDFDRVRALRDDPLAYAEWQRECVAAATSLTELGRLARPPELHLEVTASVIFVVKSVTFGRQLRKGLDSRVSAVEMEGEGLHEALYRNAHRVDALMIRGISDYANRNKARLEKTTKDAWRTFAAAGSAG